VPQVMLPPLTALISTGVLLKTRAVSGWWKVTVLFVANKKPATAAVTNGTHVLSWAHRGPLISSVDS
jgi:hypothetical protein